ncbi:hypothetical protein I79_017491 [Cricetulus griseus]|uniref:Uncharacterized protein n=1 Tax=Cricetulus griseus TaxID=10029 RepID=G3I265_CRIGR|nr:hypothetical protein I79_017491 [Cricetulus griseus]ERE84927.1 hypothetical protein H671_2g5594 [Cricetulus griseus]
MVLHASFNHAESFPADLLVLIPSDGLYKALVSQQEVKLRSSLIRILIYELKASGKVYSVQSKKPFH